MIDTTTDEDQGDAGPVVLVGGAPLSGKTAVARLLAQRCGLPVISTDDLGEAARAVTSPASHVDLHRCNLVDYRDYYASNPPARLLDDALLAHHALWPALEAVIRRHLEWAGPAVIEGWALLPRLVLAIASPRLRAVWIEVPEPAMRARLQAEPDFARGAADPSLVIERFVSRSARLNDWLRDQASECRLPYVVLSGLESPYDVSSTCLEAMGLKAAATGYRASGDALRAAHPYGGQHHMEADAALVRLLRDLEERLLRSDVRRSPTALGDLLADDFVEFGSSGRVFDKQQIIDALHQESARSPRSVLDFRTSVLGPRVVLATYRLSWSDGEVSQHSLRSSIWKLVGERWQMIFHQGTPSRAR
jgi:hypothetical protein